MILENAFLSGAKAFFNPKVYLDKLRDKRAAVQLNAERFRDQALILSRQGHEETRQLQYLSIHHQSALGQGMSLLNDQQKAIYRRLEPLELLARIPVLEVLLKSLTDQHEAEERLATKRRPRKSKKTLQGQVAGSSESPSRTTPEELLSALEYEESVLLADHVELVQIGRQMDSEKFDVDRVNAIRNNPRLLSWLRLDQSELLLVDANSEQPSIPLDTALIAAQLYSGLLQVSQDTDSAIISAPVLPLAYFSSQHTDIASDPSAWPSETAMSLLCQLLSLLTTMPSLKTFLSPAILDTIRDTVDPMSVRSITQHLCTVLSALPPTAMVFVMIDNLQIFSHFPTQQESEARALITSLVELWRQHQAGYDRGSKYASSNITATLKFLFMSTTSCDWLEGILTDDETVNIPREVAPGLGVMLEAIDWPLHEADW